MVTAAVAGQAKQRAAEGAVVAANESFKSWEPQPRRRPANPWRTWRRPQSLSLWRCGCGGRPSNAADLREQGRPRCGRQGGSNPGGRNHEGAPQTPGVQGHRGLPYGLRGCGGRQRNAAPRSCSGPWLRQTGRSNPVPATRVGRRDARVAVHGKGHSVFPSGPCGCGGSQRTL
jgi:hypothetical protein